MNKKISLVLAIVFCALLLYAGAAQAGLRRESMVEYFDKIGPVAVYIPLIVNTSSDSNVDLEGLKNEIEKALKNRISHTFNIAASEADADIVIDINVTGYYWTEEDPVDMIISPLAAAVDKAKDENYARMEMNVVITEAATGRVLWRKEVQSTITDDTMTKEASYGMSNERIAKNFVKELFR